MTSTPARVRVRRPIGGLSPEERAAALRAREGAPVDWLLVKNLVGLLLLLAAVAGVLTAAWCAHPLLGLGVTSIPVGAAGWHLATSEA